MRSNRYAIQMPACPDDFLTGTPFCLRTIQSELPDLVQKLLKSHGADCTPDNRSSLTTSPLLVIKTASHPWEVIDDTNLLAIAADRGLQRLLFMPRGYKLSTERIDTNIPTKDFTGSFAAFVSEILKNRSDTIYLQVSPHTRSEYLVPVIRFLKPAAKLIVEYYDMGGLFSPARLKSGIGYNQSECDQARLSAWCAANGADAVIVKSSGPDWNRLANSFKCPVFSWFPMQTKLRQAAARPTATGPSKSGKKRRVVFAGSLGDTELVKGSSAASDANFLETLAILMAHDDIELGIFNAADRRLLGESQQRFTAVESWFAQFSRRHTYSPALKEDDLIISIKDYDFGFFCVHYADPVIEHVGRLAIPNRVMAYLCAGLPIIVDSYAEAIAELVSEFGAGIVVHPRNYPNVPHMLCEANMESLRIGVANLRQHIVLRNDRTIEELKNLVSSISDKPF